MPLAHAQADFPNKPIRLLVGYSAGGGMDALARMLSARLPAILGQQVVVDNRPGATGMIAADHVAKAAPDGHTLLMGESGLLIAAQMQAKSLVDPLKDLTPVASTFMLPLMIVANNEVPANNPKELVALLKKSPGRYSYATSGVGTVHHLGFELLKARTESFVVHVPYRGASQIVPDVISGQVPIGVVSAAAGLAQAKAGKLRGIGLMSTGKLPGGEDLPAMADALPDFDVAPRIMLLAPNGTPPAVIAKLDAAVRTVLASPELIKTAALQGASPAYMAPAELAREMQQEVSMMGTSISFYRGPEFTESLRRAMEEATGVPCTTMSHAVVRALQALGVQRVAVATSYIPELNDRLAAYLAHAGITVTAIEGMSITGVKEVGEVGTEALVALSRKVHARDPSAQGIFISCGGLLTLDALRRLEDELGLPATASSPAGFWDVVRLGGWDAASAGHGRLFAPA